MGRKKRKLINANLNTTFHAVGQGLFCSNFLNFMDSNNRNFPFVFIYDCGSFSEGLLEERVKEFVQTWWDKSDNEKNRRIDLFVLSHLHIDHYSGLKYLFKEGLKIDVIVLPYLNPWERLLVLIEELEEVDGDISKEDVRLILQPEEYLLENGKVNLIIFMDEKEKSRSEKEEDFQLNTDLSKDFVKEVKEAIGESSIKDNIASVGNSLILKRYNLWKLCFFYMKKNFLPNKFEDCIKEELSISSINNIELIFPEFNDKGEIEYLNFKVKEGEEGKSSAKITIDQLKECYNKLGVGSKQRNQSSILLLHYPINFLKSLVVPTTYQHCAIDLQCFYRCLMYRQIAQLYTGDAPWKALNNAPFGRISKALYLIQVPHHGSGGETYWNEQLLKKFSCCMFWVIPAGIENKYRHPSYEVISGILEGGKVPAWVNEKEEFRINFIANWSIPYK